MAKKYYRCHAHTNPFRYEMLDLPNAPEEMDWSLHFENGKAPEFIDIGCGYGRFLFKSAEATPAANVLGLEIRDKVVEFVELRTKDIKNASVIKTNALLFLPNYFQPKSLSKIFILFPDPHFKKRKQKGRVVCRQMMQVYKFLLKDDGEIYISTDVDHLFKDMCQVFDDSGLFEMKEPENDVLFEMCYKDTNEAHRAGVKSGHTFGRIYKVIQK
ncbi:tRNA (guanine-N7-)-methyltransferase [Enteropsectra breve]|nr:tRNA (guanine-N7-)-methyltransferase [Enteropsectra breve]